MHGSTVGEQHVIPGGEETGAVVVDIGSSSLRAGFAGDDAPRVVSSSLHGVYCGEQRVCCPLNLYKPLPEVEVRPCVLFDARSRRASLHSDASFEYLMRFALDRLGYFMDSGIDHPVLLTEPNRHSPSYRETVLELMMEQFKAPAAAFIKRAVGACFANGRESGTVVDIGASLTSVAPVFEGFCLQGPLREFGIGGNLLDETLQWLLRRRAGVAQMRLPFEHVGGLTKSFLTYARLQALQDFRHEHCSAMAKTPIPAVVMMSWGSPPSGDFSAPLELPDKTTVDGGKVRQFAHVIPELLMDPSPLVSNWPPDLVEMGPGPDVSAGPAAPDISGFPGLCPAVSQAVAACDVDIRRLVNDIVLCGGASFIKDLPTRLLAGLHSVTSDRGLERGLATLDPNALSAAALSRCKVTAAAARIDRESQGWLGGSVLASLGTFQQLWISRAEYEEEGARAVLDKASW